MRKLISRTFLEPRIQEIGKIKIGGRGPKMKGKARAYQPVKFDHFEVVTLDRKGGDGAFIRDETIHKIVGANPRELDGILMFPEIDQNLMTSMVHYEGRKLSIRCDGEEMIEIDPENRYALNVQPCLRAQGMECPCKFYARLSIQLLASPTTEGFYTFRTTSRETLNNIQTALESIYERFGSLFQAPVRLKMYQSEDLYLVDGKEQYGKSWKVALLLNVSLAEAALQMVAARELLDTTRDKLMLRGETVSNDLDERDKEAEEEIAEEFFPEEEPAAEENVVEGEFTIEPSEDDGDETEPEPEAQEVPEENAESDPAEEQIAILISLRDEARKENLLDATAEQFIADAIKSRKLDEINKVTRALNRRFEEAEKQAKKG